MIYDISQPLFNCEVYPGDPSPEKKLIQSIEQGDVCNLTYLSLCAHNGTHVDAPLHFLKNGKGICEVSLDKFIGPAYVFSHEGELRKEDAERVLEEAEKRHPEAGKKLLMKGKAYVSSEAAEVFAEAKIDLFGNESQTVGPEDAPMKVHLILLKEEVVLLEGIRLRNVEEGVYLLNCAPIDLGRSDGSPCRAILMEL